MNQILSLASLKTFDGSPSFLGQRPNSNVICEPLGGLTPISEPLFSSHFVPIDLNSFQVLYICHVLFHFFEYTFYFVRNTIIYLLLLPVFLPLTLNHSYKLLPA